MGPELVRLWNPNLEVWGHQMIVISKQLNIFSGSSLGRSLRGPWTAPAKPLQNNGGKCFQIFGQGLFVFFCRQTQCCRKHRPEFIFFETDSLLPKISARVFLETDSLFPKVSARFFLRQTHCCQKFRREFYFKTASLLPKISARVFFGDRLTDAENFGQFFFFFFFGDRLIVADQQGTGKPGNSQISQETAHEAKKTHRGKHANEQTENNPV